MHFSPTFRDFCKNNTHNINYMAALIFPKNLNLRQVSVDSEMPILGQAPSRIIDVKIDFCGVDIPKEFAVGYGLDYAQRYRNLPYVGVLDESLL